MSAKFLNRKVIHGIKLKESETQPVFDIKIRKSLRSSFFQKDNHGKHSCKKNIHFNLQQDNRSIYPKFPVNHSLHKAGQARQMVNLSN
jgi:hypothetical protein